MKLTQTIAIVSFEKKYCLGDRTQFVELFIKITPPNIDSDVEQNSSARLFFFNRSLGLR